MTVSEVVNAIQASTPENPVILRMEVWTGGVANPPPPLEFTVSAFNVAEPTPAPPVATTFWVVGDYVNVRDAPAGNIVTKLLKGASVDVDMSTAKDVAPNKWAQILTPALKGEWVAVNVLSATHP